MEKQILTRQDIQKALTEKIHKKRSAALLVTAVDVLAAVCLLLYLPVLLTGNRLHTYGGLHIHPAAILILCPAVITLFTLFVLKYYYIDLFRIKNGKFYFTKEKLITKEKKEISFYRRTETQNLLHFEKAFVAVDKSVYGDAQAGDVFYTVYTGKKDLQLVFNTKIYVFE